MINFEYSIESVEWRNNDTKEIVSAYWKIVASDGSNTIEQDGDYQFLDVDATAPEFVPFDNVTKEMVHGWVFDNMVTTDTEAFLTEQLNKLANPETLYGTPWS